VDDATESYVMRGATGWRPQNGRNHRELTPRQKCFVGEYLLDLNATKAAIRAGYSEKSAEVTGSRMLRNAKVRAAVDQAMEKRAKRNELSADYVIDGIKETIERCRQARPVLDRKGKPVLVETPAGEQVPAYVFEPFAVLKGYELLGKHLKMFTDRSEVDFKGKLVLVTNVPEPKRDKA